jgi:DNA modification methylase
MTTPATHALPANAVIEGDCLNIMARWPDACLDLVYADPPFNTGSTRNAPAGRYPDAWRTVDDYLAFMQPRLTDMARLLKPAGCLLLHCDWRTAHHLRLMLDDLLGAARFVNHLIWSYGLGGSSPRRFARKHDDILFYANSDDYYFAPPMVPATSNRMRGEMKKATDVIAIPAINNMAAERCGYPTQKPLALLRLLIEACCPAAGIVLDPFAGSGTTLVAASQLQRRYLGIDCNPDAVAIARRRLSTIQST